MRQEVTALSDSCSCIVSSKCAPQPFVHGDCLFTTTRGRIVVKIFWNALNFKYLGTDSHKLKFTMKWKSNNKYWEELISYFSLIRHGPPRKRHEQFFVATGTSLPCCYLATIWEYTDRPIDSPLIRHGPHRKWRLQQFFVATGTSLPSCYLATVGGYTDIPIEPPLIWHGPHRKWCVQQFYYCCVYSLLRERVYRAFA
jgi:hypothetical protein